MHIHIYSYYIFKSHTHISISYICISLYHIYMSHCSRILLSVSLLSCIHGMHMLLFRFFYSYTYTYIYQAYTMHICLTFINLYIYTSQASISNYTIYAYIASSCIYISIYPFIHIVISYIYFPFYIHNHILFNAYISSTYFCSYFIRVPSIHALHTYLSLCIIPFHVFIAIIYFLTILLSHHIIISCNSGMHFIHMPSISCITFICCFIL